MQEGPAPAPAAHPGGVQDFFIFIFLCLFIFSYLGVQVKVQLLSHGFAGSHPSVRTCVLKLVLPRVFDWSVRMYNHTKTLNNRNKNAKYHSYSLPVVITETPDYSKISVRLELSAETRIVINRHIFILF